MKEYYLVPKYDNSESFYNKARVIVSNEGSELISYITKVAQIKNGKATV